MRVPGGGAAATGIVRVIARVREEVAEAHDAAGDGDGWAQGLAECGRGDGERGGKDDGGGDTDHGVNGSGSGWIPCRSRSE